ncbi:NRDE-2, necessary for RNA interference-domain-containing protein [Biscogniauxia mediterranea]|nr:NRDE-2, necessary for RNA interference-domain-containing protein [Biscogniauxia mediterranea]
MSSHREGKRPTAVPKFASFKPTPTPTPQPEPEPKPESEPQTTLGRAGKGVDELRRSQDDERQIPNRGRDRHRHRHRPPIDDASHQPDARSVQPPQSSATQGPSQNDVYLIDKRGDALIRRYGSNNRHDVPAYRRIGAGRLLGAAGFMSIDRSGTREEFFIRSHGEGGSLLSSDKKTLLAKGIRLKSQPVRVRREQPQATSGTEDYLSLRVSKKRKRDGNVSEESSGDERPSYRSIHGKSKSHEHSDSDELYESDFSASEMMQEVDDPVNRKTVELSRKVRESPDDIASWFGLVDHQDTLLQLNQSGDGRPTIAEIKSYADIKLSMLEQALSHAKDDSQREKLHLRMMREGTKIWDSQTASKRWDKTIEKYPTSFEVWRENMNFRQSMLSSFRFEEIKQLYIDRLRYLSNEASKFSQTADQIQLFEHMIYVFLRLTRFISDAGYSELATAAWQATLEANFARPATLAQCTEAEALPSFQEFWESEVARMGEEQAQGWSAFEKNGGAQEPPDPKASSTTTLPTTRDGYKAWSVVEQCKARNATIPARTMDEGDEDDPFRVIMFADIQDIVLFLPTDIIRAVQRQLLDAFLIFCQLPAAFCAGSLANKMIQDSFLIRSAKTNITSKMDSKHDTTLDSEERIKRTPDFSHEYQRMNNTPEVLFPSSNWFRYMNQLRGIIPHDQYLWISNTLKQLSRTFAVKDLAAYYLAFESLNEPGNEKKSAKTLLKQDPTNLDLYLGYSMLEWERGNKTAARNVVTAAMSLSAISSHDRLRLIITSAEIELQDGELDKSILQLCALAEDSPRTTPMPGSTSASSAQILKTRQLLVSNRDYLVSSGDLSNATIYAKGLALFEYLTCRSGKEPCSQGQGDIWSAISSISTYSSDLVSRGYGETSEHEMLLQFAARLLYHHATHGSFRSGFLREQLTQYINYFRKNTMFLSLFAWREERLSIDDRVRSLLSNVVLIEPHACISNHVFAIRHELQAGNAHSARAAFEHALANESCKNHPGLWVAYIRFCHDRKELRSKAKDVFYRAIQCCPWSKDVFMEAFITLIRDMDSSELKSVYNTLCDKGLRVHVEMEEFVEKWRRERKEKVDKNDRR